MTDHNSRPELIRFNTVHAAITTYAMLSIVHQREFKRVSPREIDGEIQKFDIDEEFNKFRSYRTTFPLLIYNALIIEGTIRSIIISYLDELIDKVHNDTSEEREYLYAINSLIQIQLVNVTFNTSWNTLTDTYKNFFKKTLYDDLELEEELRSTIAVLFDLRNKFAHGTSILYPKINTTELGGLGDYPQKWINQLGNISSYLEKNFDGEDIFERLADFKVPKHFFDATKKLFNKIKIRHDSRPGLVGVNIREVCKYEFGFYLQDYPPYI